MLSHVNLLLGSGPTYQRGDIVPYWPYFNEEHDRLREQIRAFVETEVTPFVQEWENHGAFPLSVLRKMGQKGWLGLRYPRTVGGQGRDYFSAIVLSEELGRCGAGGFAMAIAVQTEMATPPIMKFGTPEQIAHYLAPAITGEKLACIGITEPDHGSDVASIETRATRVGEQWVINGSKLFITNGPRANFITLVARTGNQSGYKGMSLFLVDLDRPGVSVEKALDKVGMRSSDTALLHFDNVRVPLNSLLGEEDRGFYHIMWELQGERLIGSVSSMALAHRAYELVKRQFEQEPRSGHQRGREVIQHQIANMDVEIEACRQLTYAVAQRFSQDGGNSQDIARDIAIAKIACAQMACRVIDEGVEILGSDALIQGHPMERMWRDVRLKRIGAGTDEIMKEIIARHLNLKHWERG